MENNYYPPKDPMSNVDFHIAKSRYTCSGGNNPCLICGKELMKGTHKFVVLDETCSQIVDPRFVPDKNGGLHPIGNDCAKKLGVERYLLKAEKR